MTYKQSSKRLQNQVLETLLANSTDAKDEWVSQSTVYLACVAHADMEADEVQQALHQLSQNKKIDVDDGRYRPVEGLD